MPWRKGVRHASQVIFHPPDSASSQQQLAIHDAAHRFRGSTAMHRVHGLTRPGMFYRFADCCDQYNAVQSTHRHVLINARVSRLYLQYSKQLHSSSSFFGISLFRPVIFWQTTAAALHCTVLSWAAFIPHEPLAGTAVTAVDYSSSIRSTAYDSKLHSFHSSQGLLLLYFEVYKYSTDKVVARLSRSIQI